MLPVDASPSGRNRLQTARIHAINRKICANRRIDGCAQRRLIFDSVTRDAAGEIQQRFLFRNLLERLRDRAQREQFAIRIQIVVLALVGRVTRRIFHLVGVCRRSRRKSLSLGPVVDPNFVRQHGLVRSEVLVHLERLVQRNQRNQICGLHLVRQEIPRRLHAAIQILRLHRRQIERTSRSAGDCADLPALRQRRPWFPGPFKPAANPLMVASFNGVAISTVWKSNEEICCGFPFSRR